jgi:hypothetical protein
LKSTKELDFGYLKFKFLFIAIYSQQKSTGCQKGKLKIRKRRGFGGFFEAPEVKQNKHHHTRIFRFQCV